MKKLFTILAVAATLVSCAKEDVVREAAREAIGFDNAFVENSTRSVETPGYSSSNLFDDFAVFGFVQDASLFEDGYERVAKDIQNGKLTSDWKYTSTQYWIADANYDFYAVAPCFAPVDGVNKNYWTVDSSNSDGATITFTTTDGTQDLLYSGIEAKQGKVSGNTAVAFNFKHILSKVKFTFENNYNASNASIRVKNINITNAYKTGKATLAVDDATTEDVDETVAWKNQADGAADFAISFGDVALDNVDTTDEAYTFGTARESYYERLLIPGEKTWNITFSVDLLVSGQLIKTYNHTATATVNFEAGKSYDFKTSITAANIDPNNEQVPIEFTATMTDWSNETSKVETTPVTPDQN